MGTFRRCIKYKSCQEFLRMTGMRRNLGRRCRADDKSKYGEIHFPTTYVEGINSLNRYIAFFLRSEIRAIEMAKSIVSHIFILPTVIYNWRGRAYYYDAFLDQCLVYLGVCQTGKRNGKASRARVNRFLPFSLRSSIPRHVS